MNYTAEQFIAMPDFINLKQQNLKYLDALTYVAIRSFIDNEKDYSYPPYDKIMERSGLGRTFIASSINRLEAAGFFRIERSKREGTCNRYYFSRVGHFEKLSYDILYKTADLSTNERAMLVCLRQFFNHGMLTSAYSITELAEHLGVSYKQVYGPLKGLIANVYIIEVCKPHKLTNNSTKYLKLANKITWPLPNIKIIDIDNVPKMKVA